MCTTPLNVFLAFVALTVIFAVVLAIRDQVKADVEGARFWSLDATPISSMPLAGLLRQPYDELFREHVRLKRLREKGNAYPALNARIEELGLARDYVEIHGPDTSPAARKRPRNAIPARAVRVREMEAAQERPRLLTFQGGAKRLPGKGRGEIQCRS